MKHNKRPVWAFFCVFLFFLISESSLICILAYMKFFLRSVALLTLFFIGGRTDSFAILMKGVVYDLKTNKPLPNVNITNTYTEIGMTTDSTGQFFIEVEKGHLVEFTRLSYKIARVRIENLTIPFYRIGMHEGAFELQNVDITGNNYKTDSIEKRETYKWAINHYKLEGLEVIQHPFDALSKRNRQIWAFQKRYDYFEKEKFVDYVFNAKLIKKLTSVDSTQMEDFRRYYRPTYDQIKGWTEYEFMEYIKNSAAVFLRRRG